jgi:hypothetical protein
MARRAAAGHHGRPDDLDRHLVNVENVADVDLVDA